MPTSLAERSFSKSHFCLGVSWAVTTSCSNIKRSVSSPPTSAAPQAEVSVSPTATESSNGNGGAQESSPAQNFNLCTNFPYEKISFVEGAWSNSAEFNGCQISGEYIFQVDKFKFTEKTCQGGKITEGTFNVAETADNTGYY